MPARKPARLNSRHDTNADKRKRAAAEESMRPGRELPRGAPAALRGHAVAKGVWRRLLREYGELEAVVVTRLDLDLLVDYCTLMEELGELHTMRAAAYKLWLELSGAHDELAKAGRDSKEAAIAMALAVVGAFDAVLKLDARGDIKRKGLLGLRQALYLTPRSRAGAAPATKEPPPPEDELERMLDDVDLGPAGGGPREAKRK